MLDGLEAYSMTIERAMTQEDPGASADETTTLIPPEAKKEGEGTSFLESIAEVHYSVVDAEFIRHVIIDDDDDADAILKFAQRSSAADNNNEGWEQRNAKVQSEAR